MIRLPLYFFSPANHFNHTMTRRSPWIYVAALAGLLAVQISSRADTTDTALAKSAVLESNVAYLRVGQVKKNLADEIYAAQTALAVSNKVAGTVLDLRFAGGDDFDSALATADWFAAKKSPLAILVNGQTRGAAAALAADLREKRAGLVFGSATQAIPLTGQPLQPDIVVAVYPQDERVLMENPYAATDETNAEPSTNSLLPSVDHTTEADLVRARIKDGDQGESSISPARTDAPQPQVIRDPVLARAVDLIKGLAVVRASRS
jgi:hypothetical protein